MLATAKEETHIGPGLDFVPDWHQADLPFSGEIAVELPDDNNGNLIQKTNKTTSAFTLYEYDAENKLIRVVREDGSIVNYRFDGLGRRIEKEVDSVVTQYIYDNEDILLELDGSNNITARYTHGPGIDEPLIVETSGVSSYYHADGLGSITELTDNAGTVVQSYTYSSFDKIESQLYPNFVQPYTFTSREFDPETGLYYYRARAYDPSIGRFLSEDPIRFNGGDINLYPYVMNNPVNLTDPTGEGVILFVACAAGQLGNAIFTGIEVSRLGDQVEEIKGKIRKIENCPDKSDVEKIEEIRELQAQGIEISKRTTARIFKGVRVAVFVAFICVAAVNPIF